MVLSGKGGVGKSSIAATLALGLAERGFRVGVMDVDFHGPSIPVIFGIEGLRVMGDETGIFPAEVGNNLKVISIGLFLEDQDGAVIWRGPLKMTAIRQFMEDIHWGELDYLVIDSPPGTGDEPLSVAQLIPDAYGLIVTTPQELAMADVRKSIAFCRRIGMRLLGLVENMSGMVCPHCGERIDIFGRDGAKGMAERMRVELLASLPLDGGFAAWADRGGAKKGHYKDLDGVAGTLDGMVDRVIALTSGGMT
ncbi:MAG: Mrp/NBP35 family ATP-binding protein [Actinobacteria bacterium]|nr:Mrp/NBP35 family ATP-binding protein [Actinomycetota bacterium]